MCQVLEKQEQAADEKAEMMFKKETAKAERLRKRAEEGQVDEDDEIDDDENDDDEATDEDETSSSEFDKLQREKRKKKREEEAKAKAEREEAEAYATQRAEAQAATRIELQAYCCAALQNFSAHAAHEKTVRDEGAISCILAALRAHSTCAPIQLHGVSVWSPLLYCAQRCFVVVLSCVSLHFDWLISTLRPGLSALCNLSSDPSSKRSMAMEGAALYAEAARYHFAPSTKRLTLPTAYALGVARTRLRELISPKLHKNGVRGCGDHNVEIVPEGSLENVRPADLSKALAGLEAPAVVVVRSGDPAVEAAAVRLLRILRFCKEQLAEVESHDRKLRHVYMPQAMTLE